MGNDGSVQGIAGSVSFGPSATFTPAQHQRRTRHHGHGRSPSAPIRPRAIRPGARSPAWRRRRSTTGTPTPPAMNLNTGTGPTRSTSRPPAYRPTSQRRVDRHGQRRQRRHRRRDPRRPSTSRTRPGSGDVLNVNDSVRHHVAERSRSRAHARGRHVLWGSITGLAPATILLHDTADTSTLEPHHRNRFTRQRPGYRHVDPSSAAKRLRHGHRGQRRQRSGHPRAPSSS